MSQLEIAIEQIKQARSYSQRLLDHVGPDDWFRQPTEGVTHLAWQMGHLAIAQYRLTMDRIRGSRPGDADLIDPAYVKMFGKDSVPDSDPARYPTVEAIRAAYDRVYTHVLEELPDYTDEELQGPAGQPHPWFNTKLGALFWCARHEMMHAGQIGLLRRLLGYKPLW